MGPLVAGALLSAGSAAASFLGASRQNKANREMAREQMAFQERMANTEWQRGVADMRAAGINPAVAYSRGGASSPQGSTAQMADELAPAVSSAKGGALMRSQLEAAKAAADKAKAEAESAGVQAEYDKAWLASHGIVRRKDGSVQLDLTYPGIRDQVQANISSAMSAARLAQLQIPSLSAQAEVMSGKFGLYTEYLRRLFGATSPLIGGLGGGAAVGRFMRK